MCRSLKFIITHFSAYPFWSKRLERGCFKIYIYISKPHMPKNKNVNNPKTKPPTQSFEEKELDILRAAVDKAEERQGKATAQAPEIRKIIEILETFLWPILW